jgi:DNA repair protein RadD
VYRYLRERDGNPLIVAPTGSGKAILVAQIASDAVLQWNGRVLVLAHVKELLEQNADKLRRLAPQLQVGLYSAGLKRRDTDQPVIVAGIQSVYQKACELGRFDLIIVDECHLLPPDGEGMYRQFLADARRVNPQVRLIGLTATPFRLKSGLIYGPDQLLTEVCYEIGIRELIRDGFLSPLISRAGSLKADLSQLTVRHGEFVADEAEAAMDRDELVRAACREIVEATADRRACLIFATSVRHGAHIRQVLADDHGIECGFVTGETSAQDRAELLARFRGDSQPTLFSSPPLKYLCNVGVLTTGFDAPHVDCVALLRPTMSPGLYAQILGRGFRLAPGKTNCLVLDFGGNIVRHGPVDQLRLPEPGANPKSTKPAAKECPQCRTVLALGYSQCPECGFEFPPPKRQTHEATAARFGVLSGQICDTEFDVLDISYHVHSKRGANAESPRSMRVTYRLGLTYCVSEYICFEHPGFARRKAEQWWRQRSPEPVPATASEAVDIARETGLAEAHRVTVRNIAGETYERIVAYQLGERLAPMGAGVPDDELPF